ncbi:MAG: dephospho-CoA kinase [Pseudomonadales bacterium]
MLVIGVTGGIGSGKSAVTDRFADHDICVVDADIAARVVVEPGKPALQAIEDYFGPHLITYDGALDRAALRKIVFEDKEQRLWLEQLTHPLIGEEIMLQIQSSISPYTIFVSPLLIETSQHALTDRILLVDVPVELQVERTIARDNNSEAQVRAIIASQASREDRLARADDVIVNDKDLAHLDKEVARLHEFYLQLADKHIDRSS